MKRFELANFKEDLENKRFRQIYTFLLNFFNLLKKGEYETNYIFQTLKFIKEYLDIILVGNKEEFIEKSISNIYKKADLIEVSSLNQSQRNQFFKKQIRRQFSQNVDYLLDLFKQEVFNEALINFIPVILRNPNLNIKKTLSKILELYKKGFLDDKSLNQLLKPICNQIPKEVIRVLVKSISKLVREGHIRKNKKTITGLLKILYEYGDIYPEIITTEFEDLLLILKAMKLEDQMFIVLILEIISQSIEDRPDLFGSFFFKFLSLSKIIGSYPKEVSMNYVQTLKRLYHTDKSSYLKSFFNNHGPNLEELFKYMLLEIEELNEFLLEFLIDYLEYIRTINYNGKISKKLLELYLKSLIFLTENDLESEYALFSIIHQLKIKNFHFKRNIEQTELKIAFRLLIEEVKDYIAIIFS